MKKNQAGFSAVEALIILAVVGVIGAVGWIVLQQNSDPAKQSTAQTSTSQQSGEQKSDAQQYSKAIWTYTGSDWQANGYTPPTCPSNPLLQPPANMAKVTSILYPGQTRGGNYKPHGGFRFDGVANDKISVTAPIDGYLIRGGRYLVNGELQYTFDVINNCGYMYRVGHLLKLTSTFQAIADKLPAAVEGDSRTTNVEPNVLVKKGEVLATSVGITVGGTNTFFDFGVYDLRTKNEASKSTSYAAKYGAELEQHAVCWFDLLPKADSAKVKSLPAGDPTSGKNSDYCK